MSAHPILAPVLALVALGRAYVASNAARIAMRALLGLRPLAS